MVKGRRSRRADQESPKDSGPAPVGPEAQTPPDPQTQTPPDERITRIRELIRLFIKQVEALGQARTARDRVSLREEARRFESDLIHHALALTGGHQRRAARLLGIKATTLNEKIKRYQIQPARLSAVATAGAPDRDATKDANPPDKARRSRKNGSGGKPPA